MFFSTALDTLCTLSLPQSLLALLGALFLYLLLLTLYRLYLHPLSAYPGPRLAAATSLVEFYHDVLRGGQYQFQILHWHTLYGPIIRISPSEIHISDPAFYDELYKGGKRDKFSFSADLTATPTSYFSAVDHAVHRRKRAPFNEFFSKRNVEGLEGRIKKHVMNLCSRIEEVRGTGEVVNLKYAFAALTVDVVSEYAFARPFGALQDPKFAPQWLDAVEGIVTGCHLNAFFPWLPKLMKKLPLAVVRWVNPHVGTVVEYQRELMEVIRGVMKEEPGKKDGDAEGEGATIFHSLLQSKDLHPEDRNLLHFTEEAQNLVGAGQITTAAHLTTTTFHVLSNPEILENLREELETAIPDPTDDLPSVRELERLPYLSAVCPLFSLPLSTPSTPSPQIQSQLTPPPFHPKQILSESHRLSPGVIHRLTRLSPSSPITYHPSLPTPSSTSTPTPPITFPPRTPLSTSSLSLHLSPTLFPSPETFSPSRWLPQNQNPSPNSSSPPEHTSSEQIAHLKHFLVPYSKGPRSCIGQNLAQAELYLTLAAVFRKFPRMELFETERGRDVDASRDFVVGLPERGSRGVRVVVK